MLEETTNNANIITTTTTTTTNEPTLTQYEAERNARIQKNIERMKSFGIDDARKKVMTMESKNKNNATSSLLSKKRVKKRSENATTMDRSKQPRRTSSRVRGEKAPDVFVPDERNLWEPTYNEEIYTQRQVSNLGDRKSEWQLFVSGYDQQGRRLYDNNRGVCCHQCRQKTLGTHTTCRKCNMMRGKFCGDCIFMRYGENVLEINENPEWECPVCRDICNCSFCRTKKGWMPTGNMYRAAIASGYKSVAHYLVLSRQDDEEKAKLCEEEAERVAERLQREEKRRIQENPELYAKEQEERRHRPHWLKNKK